MMNNQNTGGSIWDALKAFLVIGFLGALLAVFGYGLWNRYQQTVAEKEQVTAQHAACQTDRAQAEADKQRLAEDNQRLAGENQQLAQANGNLENAVKGLTQTNAALAAERDEARQANIALAAELETYRSQAVGGGAPGAEIGSWLAGITTDGPRTAVILILACVVMLVVWGTWSAIRRTA